MDEVDVRNQTVSVLVGFDLPAALVRDVAAVSSRVSVEQVVCTSAQEVSEALDEQVEVLYTRRPPASLAGASGLRWVQMQSAGVSHLFEHPLFESDVLLTTTSGAHAIPSAEYTIGAMIALARGFPTLVRDQDEGRWIREHGPERELHGKTLIILGYGSIGREVARLANAFHMRILASKRNPADPEDSGFVPRGIGDPQGKLPDRLVSPEEVIDWLPQADFVVSTLPLTDETRGFMDDVKLRAMKPSAFFVNVSRGAIANESDLLRALDRDWIAGAALDVFAEEPLREDSPFYDLPNVLVTPHISASRANPKYDERATSIFMENLTRYLDGRPLLNLVRRRRGY